MTNPYVSQEVYDALDKALKNKKCLAAGCSEEKTGKIKNWQSGGGMSDAVWFVKCDSCKGSGKQYPNGVESWIAEKSERLYEFSLAKNWPVLTTMQALEIVEELGIDWWKSGETYFVDSPTWGPLGTGILAITTALDLLDQIAKEL